MIAYYFSNKNDVALLLIGTNGNVNLWACTYQAKLKKTQKMFFFE